MNMQTGLSTYNVVKVIGVLALAIILLGGIWGIKANAAQKANNDKAEYQLQETELKNEIRACMENLGYYNCGITMTKVMDENGKREYRVLLHHMDLDKADSEKVNELYLMLSYIQMPEENMTVNYTIF